MLEKNKVVGCKKKTVEEAKEIVTEDKDMIIIAVATCSRRCGAVESSKWLVLKQNKSRYQSFL